MSYIIKKLVTVKGQSGTTEQKLIAINEPLYFTICD